MTIYFKCLRRNKSIRIGDRVQLLRDIVRVEGPYANQGDSGVVCGTFRNSTSGSPQRWYAQVEMDTGEIKTFRLTSLRRVE